MVEKHLDSSSTPLYVNYWKKRRRTPLIIRLLNPWDLRRYLRGRFGLRSFLREAREEGLEVSKIEQVKTAFLHTYGKYQNQECFVKVNLREICRDNLYAPEYANCLRCSSESKYFLRPLGYVDKPSYEAIVFPRIYGLDLFQCPVAKIRDNLAEIKKQVGEIHSYLSQAGLFHNDLHPGQFLMTFRDDGTFEQIYLVDLDHLSTQSNPKTGVNSDSVMFEDLLEKLQALSS